MSLRPLTGCEVLPLMATKAAAHGARKAPAPRAKGGRFATLNAFVDASMRGVGGTAVKVWLTIYRDTKSNGLAKVSDADLARRAGVTDRTVRSARGALQAAGLLVVVRRGGLNKGASTYRVRPLAAEGSFRLPAEDSFRPPRKPASYIPERDQNGRHDPIGSDALKEKARDGRGGGVA